MDSTTTTPATHAIWIRPAGTSPWKLASQASPLMETGLLGGITGSPSRMAIITPYAAPSTPTPCLKSQSMANSRRTTTPIWRAKGARLMRWPPQSVAEWAPVATTERQLEVRPARTTGTLQLARPLAPLFIASRLTIRTASGATVAYGMNMTKDPRAPM